MRNIRKLIFREDGQTLFETSIGLLLLCFMAGMTINVYYLVSFGGTLTASVYEGAVAAVESAAAGTGNSAAIATATATSVVANTSLNPNAPSATIIVCSPTLGVSGDAADCSNGSPAGFADPEAGSAGATGQFYTSSATTTQSFTAFMKGSLLGRNLIPFLPSGPLTRTFYMRSTSAISPVTSGAP